MTASPRRTADIISLTTAILAVAAGLLGARGGWWMAGLPLSWILASVAIVVSIIAIIKRERLRLALPALLLGIMAVGLPYLFSEAYLSNGVDAISLMARWIATSA